MKRLVAPVFALLVIIGLTFIPKMYAECVPIYGGGESCANPNLSIIKTVFNPISNTYVHDLGLNDTRFQPGQRVSFKITVTNTGRGKATHVVITDFLPSSLLAVAPNPDSMTGPAGATVTIQANTINPGDSAVFTVVGEVVSTLPQSVLCSNNQAKVTSSENSTGISDFSQFCVQQSITPTSTLTTVTPTPLVTSIPTVFPTTPTTTLPPTGPDALPLVALFPTGITGIILRILAMRMKRTDS